MSAADRSSTDEIERLAARAKRGDVRARDQLLGVLYPTVYAWALVRTGDPFEADDASQEAMLRVHDRLGEFRGEARFTTWVYRIVMNAVIDHRRRRERLNLRREPLNAIDREIHVFTSVEFDRADAIELVRRYVLSLPEGQRTVFHLVDIGGYSQIEVSEMLGMNSSTVRAHLFKARRAIRRRMLDEHPMLAKDALP